jgi:hypothetical protein
VEELQVSENCHSGHSIAWLASECEAALREHHSAQASDALAAGTVADLVTLWRTPEDARAALGLRPWQDLAILPQDVQAHIAAGFELLARSPSD